MESELFSPFSVSPDCPRTRPPPPTAAWEEASELGAGVGWVSVRAGPNTGDLRWPSCPTSPRRAEIAQSVVPAVAQSVGRALQPSKGLLGSFSPSLPHLPASLIAKLTSPFPRVSLNLGHPLQGDSNTLKLSFHTFSLPVDR